MGEQYEVEEDEIDLIKLLVDFIKGIQRFWKQWIIFIIVCMLLFFGIQRVSYTPMYHANASFAVQTAGGDTRNEVSSSYGFSYNAGTADQIGKTFPYILESTLFKERLKQHIGAEEINGTILANVIENSNLVTLTVDSNNPKDAEKVLKGVLEIYPEISQYVIGKTQFNIVEDAVVQEQPYNKPNDIKNLLEGAGIGIIIGVFAFAIYAFTRKTIRNVEDLKNAVNTGCLAMIPEVEQNKQDCDILSDEMDPGYVENFLSLQNQVEYFLKKENKKVLMVTSTGPMEGKTTISWNLALAMAQRGKKVILFDGDFRKADPNGKIKDTIQKDTLESMIQNNIPLEKVLKYDSEKGIYIFSVKEKLNNPIPIIESEKMKKLFADMRDFADFVIIDTPPCGILADAENFYEYVDSLLYVVRQDWTDETKIVDAIQEFPEHGNKLIGCVLNRVKKGFVGYGYGYEYSNGKYYNKRNSKKNK